MNIIICFPILVWWLYVVVTSKSPAVIDLLVLCCVILHILMLVSHKTMEDTIMGTGTSRIQCLPFLQPYVAVR